MANVVIRTIGVSGRAPRPARNLRYFHAIRHRHRLKQLPCQSRMAIKRLNTRHTFWPITPPYTTKYGKRTKKLLTFVRSLVATPAGLEPVTSAVTGRRSNQLSYGAICTSMKHKRIYYSITGPRRADRRVAPRQCQAHPLPLQAIATPAIPALPIPWWAVVWRGFDRYADRAAQA